MYSITIETLHACFEHDNHNNNDKNKHHEQEFDILNLSIGWLIVIGFSIIVSCYCCFGYFICRFKNSMVDKRKMTNINNPVVHDPSQMSNIPHYRFWCRICELSMDGCKVTFKTIMKCVSKSITLTKSKSSGKKWIKYSGNQYDSLPSGRHSDSYLN